jgi:hypothetical protein
MDRHAIRDVINTLTYLKEIPTCHIAVFSSHFNVC